MNKWEKQILQSQLDSEQEALDEIKKTYIAAINQIDDRISALMGRTDIENLQSIIYQVDYQRALKKQISAILDEMNAGQFQTVSEYLTSCYENGFIGVMYDLKGQGIPIISPIDQRQVISAVINNSKISEGLYKKLGCDTDKLKKTINNEVSRGIATGLSYADIAKNISRVSNVSMNNTFRIARTEGHRISNEAAYDAQRKAKAAGADVVKQWDAALDKRTRSHHCQLDGQIREIDEPFEIDGHKAMYPGAFGVAAEDINCRCASLQRATWALDDDELQTLKDRAAYYGLDKAKDFEDFKQKYLNTVENSENISYNSGAKSGAYNNKNDPDGSKRDAHADRYYEELRNNKKQNIIFSISRNSGVKESTISNVYDHLLINEYDLDGEKRRFDTDYDIAESLERLITGKNVQEHDIILLQHEALEYRLMNEDGLSYAEAHSMANEFFNYGEALKKFLKGSSE